MKIGIWPFDHDRDKREGSSRIRCEWLIKYWPEAEEYKIGKNYDVILFQKVYFPEFMERFNGIKIMDFCDPEWLEGLPVRKCIELADAVTVSSEGLYQFFNIAIKNKPVKLIKDRVDMEINKQKKIHKGQAKTVVWFGYSQNAHVLKDTIKRLKEFDLDLIIISDNNVSKSLCGTLNADYLDKIKFYHFNEKTYNEQIIKGDIVLLPQSIRPRDRFKSENKTVHSWSLNMPVANTLEGLIRLMDESERIKETEKNMKIVLEEYQVKKSVEEYKKLIDEIKSSRFDRI